MRAGIQEFVKVPGCLRNRIRRRDADAIEAEFKGFPGQRALQIWKREASGFVQKSRST